MDTLPKPRLVELSRDFGVVVKKSATKEEQVRALVHKTRAPLSDILRALGRDELKLACRAHGLDDRGRSREELALRLLKQGNAAESRSPSSDALPYRLQPEKGDIVAVRQRQYLVTEVLPPSTQGAMTVVRLVCLDDDAQGRPLEVLWELELGARVLTPKAEGLGAISKLDEPREFAAYFHALKWSRVTASEGNLFQAPFRAGIALKSYQLTPLRKALELPRANLFIADDVGLGKTIEAGLVVQELLLRQRIDWVLIVCPASVTLQWKQELERRFGLRFEVYNRDFVMRRRQERGFQVNPWTTHHRFIISYQTFRRPEYRDALLNLLDRKRRKSLLVLDEAHTAAPATATKYAIDSLTTKAIRDLCDRFENRLFLSATPHNGHSNSFSALLEMLDPQRFLRGTAVSGPEQLTPVMVRRLKSDLIAANVSGFPVRRLVQIDLVHDGSAWQARAVCDDGPARTTPLGEGSPVELELSQVLAEYTGLACPAKGSGRLVFINLQKRLLSSIEAFARTLEKHAAGIGQERPARTTSSEADWDSDAYPEVDCQGDAEGYQRAAVEGDHDAGGDAFDEAEGGLSSEAEDQQTEIAIGAASGRLGGLTREASALLDRLLALARKHRMAADAKARALVAWIREHMCPAVGIGGARSGASRAWKDERLIVFTEYGHTKGYLKKLLEAAIEGTDRAEDRIRVFDGGMSEKNRALLQEEFNGDPANYPVRILIATDAAREGVNLQGHCADLFHYDIPWNPARLEQRNGRIDRTLQPKDEVRCHYFIYPDREEDQVLRAVVGKVGRIQRELGSVGAVVFDSIAELLERTGIDRHVLARIDEQEKDARDTSCASKELEQVRSAHLKKEIHEAGKILDRSRDVLEFEARLLRDALDVGFAWAGAKGLAPAPSPKDEPTLKAFELPDLGDGWAATLDSARPARRPEESLWDWRKRTPLPVVFDAPEKLSTPVVQLHLQHPIVQRILARFLAQGYSAHDLSRVTVLLQPKHANPRVIALGRLSIFGQGAARLHDDLLAVAATFGADDDAPLVPFGEEKDREAVDQLESLFAESPKLAKVNDRVQKRLRAMAPKHFAELWPHIEHEADAQAHEVERKLRSRGESESKALAKIIEGQIRLAERTLQVELSFADKEREQREQRERDRKHIDARRKTLARELEDEPRAIAASYETVRRRVEPVGLVYLWPTTM